MDGIIVIVAVIVIPILFFVAICRWIFRIDTIVGLMIKTNSNLEAIINNQATQEKNIVSWLKRLDWYEQQKRKEK